MLDIKRIREKTDEVREGLARRGMNSDLIDQVLTFDKERRALITEADELKNKRNTVSKEIGIRKKNGEDTSAIQTEMRAIGDRVAAIDTLLRDVEENQRNVMLSIPNVPCATIPTGSDASANRVAKVQGEPRVFDFEPLDHIAIGARAIVGGASVVAKDVPEDAFVTGYPARPHRQWMASQAALGRLPEFMKQARKVRED